LKRLLAIVASLALVGWLVSAGGWRGIGALLERVGPGAFAAALAGFVVSYFLRALRLHDEFRIHGRFGACLRIVLVHNAMVNVVPFRGGEAALPLLLRQTFGTPLPRAVASLFWFRLQDALVVALLAVLVWPGLAWALRAGGVVLLVAFALYLPRWARAPHDWASGGALASKLAKLRDALGESTRHARLGWLWTIANWAVKLLTQAWLLSVLLDTQVAHGAAGALGAELAAILPIQGVAGFGTYEAGAAAAMLPSGIALARGLQAALALHLFVIASAVAAGAIAWLCPAGAAPASELRPDSKSVPRP
jgi:hypothetical protein